MRKALIVGIDHYDNISPLSGCVNDAYAVKAMLERDADGSVNFQTPRLMVGTGPGRGVIRRDLREAVRELFQDRSDVALFYFAGHGYIDETGGFLCSSDNADGNDGFPLAELMTFANNSQATNKVIILDSCHSGAVGGSHIHNAFSEIKDGTTILTASNKDQYAMEVLGGGAGVFTTLLVDALNGSAANLLGEVTPGSVYAHIDQSLGTWGQRPVFKTNVQKFISLRKADPPIPLQDLHALTMHFPAPGFQLRLDPAYEPERNEEQKKDSTIPPPDPAKTAVFAMLQRYARVNLLKPVDAPHMWHAAMESKACELTVLGEHYRRLVEQGLI
ncbi:caspase family protein [Bosea sp. ASV33]|uniref:caspase family protein n=1 Tax=Bosea sp. ASV33 TaxID=2795106 RepID=UPI0018EBDED7|nr:caspase family protein [Bosea sp. ASV33]